MLHAGAEEKCNYANGFLEILLDVGEGNDGSVGVVDAFAALCGLFPVFARFEVFGPPGECAALFGSCAVDLAFALFEEDAVVGAGMLEES